MTLTTAAFGLFVVVWLSLFSHYWTLRYLHWAHPFLCFLTSHLCVIFLPSLPFTRPATFLSLPIPISTDTYFAVSFLSSLLIATCVLSFYPMTSTRSTNQRCTSSQCLREQPWAQRSAASSPRTPTWERTRTWLIWSKMAESSSKSPLMLRRRKLLSPSRRYN